MKITKEFLKEYQAIHHWLKKNYGKADKCENKNCTKKSQTYEWALKPNKEYKRKRENFSKLCKSCHAKQDLTIEGIESTRRANIGASRISKKPLYCMKCNELIYEAKIGTKMCRPCFKEHIKKYRFKYNREIKDKEKGKQAVKRWIKNNREKYNEYHKEYWRKNFSKKNYEKTNKS
jgi:hypothetical protein